jgi:hypothetical protein
MKAYKHIGVNPLVFKTADGERVIEPDTDRFDAELDPELESFLIRIEAIAPLEITQDPPQPAQE